MNTTDRASQHRKLQAELATFARLLPQLLQTHRDAYVAIHNGEVIASGADALGVGRFAYAIAGNAAFLIVQVRDTEPPPVRLPSFRTELSTLPLVMDAVHG
jgi:hypothetical protein